MAFAALPKPPTLLGYYRTLAPSAGVRVSPLCLGAMSFGDAWKGWLGECTKETAFSILDAFYEAGGNFIDTANNYQAEESELWLGEWMKARGNRDQLVLATKYTTGYKAPSKNVPIRANYQGNHSKSLHLSVADSLKKLQTDYIDLLWLHWWDFSTSIPEVMQSLHHMVMSGKVLYLGVSDTPAWIVAKANQYARDHALTPFCTYQGLWNAAHRDFERDILPLCEDDGMSVCPWRALGGGIFKKAEDLSSGEGRKTASGQSQGELNITMALDKLAQKHKTRITSIALAYVRAKYAYVFPIVGCRTKDHLLSNIEALSIMLTPEEVQEIESVDHFDVGFPLNMLSGEIIGDGKYEAPLNPSNVPLVKASAYIDVPTRPGPPKPRTE